VAWKNVVSGPLIELWSIFKGSSCMRRDGVQVPGLLIGGESLIYTGRTMEEQSVMRDTARLLNMEGGEVQYDLVHTFQFFSI